MSFFLKLCYSPPLILFVASCFLVYYLVYTRHIQHWKASNIPFTRPFFLLGHKHFFKLFSNSITVPLDMIYRDNEDKDLVGFFFMFFPIILIRKPSIIKELHGKSFDKMFENGFYPVKDEVAYQNVVPLAYDRAIWKTARSTLTASLQISKLETSDFSKFKKQIERLWYHAGKFEQVGKPFDIQDAALKFSVDSVSAWNFSEDANSWEKKTILSEISESILEASFQRLWSFLVLFLLPSLQYFNCLRFIRREYIDSVTEFLEKEIGYRDQHKIHNDDFIDHLMSLRKPEAPLKTSEASQNDKGIGLQEMAGSILTWSFAGFESTSQLCIFAVHLLSLHPKYQDKIREELNEAMKKLNVTEITFQVVRELELTNCCLLETTRLYPVLPVLVRRCTKDFQIPGTKYKLRKGDLTYTLPKSIHHDPRYFKDPLKFHPERFSAGNEGSDRLDMLLSFGLGPRKCPGYKIAVPLAVLFIASLLYKFEVRPRSNMKRMDATDYDPLGFTNRPRSKFLVDLIPRKFS